MKYYLNIKALLEETQSSFREEATNYSQQIQNNCRIVERFDEVLIQKASKVSLEETNKAIRDKYDTQFERYDRRLIEDARQRDLYVASFNNFSTVIESKIYEQVKKVVK